MRPIVVVAGNADFPFGPLVPGRQIVVSDRPVGQRGTVGHAVARGHAEVVGVEAPRLHAIDGGAAADAVGEVLVFAIVRRDDALAAVGGDRDPRVAGHRRAGVDTVGREPLIAQVVAVAAVGIGAPRPALDDEHPFARLGEHARRDPAPCPGADDDHVIIGAAVDVSAGAFVRRDLRRTVRPLGQAVGVADHRPARRVLVAAVAGIGVNALRSQPDECDEPRLVGNLAAWRPVRRV